jgi:hypothetical protein
LTLLPAVLLLIMMVWLMLLSMCKLMLTVHLEL